MGRVAPWTKYNIEWREVKEWRQNGRSLCDRNNSERFPPISTSPQIVYSFKWLPEHVSTMLGASTVKVYSEQQQSGLGKMPREIRLAIWKYVIAGQRFTISRKEKRTAHSVLPRDNILFGKARKVPIYKLGPEDCQNKFEDAEKMAAVNLLPLLLTSKKFYFEAVDILYRYNEFEFITLSGLHLFLFQSPIFSLHSIQAITLSWGGFERWRRYRLVGYETDQSWQEICDTIVSLGSLRRLSIEISGVIQALEDREEQHTLINRIVLPLASLPEHIEFTLAITSFNGSPNVVIRAPFGDLESVLHDPRESSDDEASDQEEADTI
ncbi:hypothetical protein B0I35DRAFT_444842 [Stachybotrys elegans]|uniref:DUF7730 domain-containing protein n=1 Tax=Stachybotrys elegans TaxID=80388 RepID=A0A8K0SAI0_9HYPO|nr:hypothetical protein B0I35DRAFT_444842 [Stachybotrys elegans]